MQCASARLYGVIAAWTGHAPAPRCTGVKLAVCDVEEPNPWLWSNVLKAELATTRLALNSMSVVDASGDAGRND